MQSPEKFLFKYPRLLTARYGPAGRSFSPKSSKLPAKHINIKLFADEIFKTNKHKSVLKITAEHICAPDADFTFFHGFKLKKCGRDFFCIFCVLPAGRKEITKIIVPAQKYSSIKAVRNKRFLTAVSNPFPPFALKTAGWFCVLPAFRNTDSAQTTEESDGKDGMGIFPVERKNLSDFYQYMPVKRFCIRLLLKLQKSRFINFFLIKTADK